MKKIFILLFTSLFFCFSTFGCSDDIKKHIENIDPINDISELDSISSKKELNLYSDQTLNKYKRIFEKNDIKYTITPDNQAIFNTDVKYKKTGKEYSKNFLVTVGENTVEANASIRTMVCLTFHIDTRFEETNKDIDLIYNLLKNVKVSYTNVTQFTDAINATLDSFNEGVEASYLQDNANCKIFLEKNDNVAMLFIYTDNSIPLNISPQIKPLKFKTHEEYQDFMIETNKMIGNIYNVNTSTTGEPFMYDDTLIGISQASPSMPQSDGDFSMDLELNLNYNGNIIENTDMIKKIVAILNERLNYTINYKELENYFLSNGLVKNFLYNIDAGNNVEKAIDNLYSDGSLIHTLCNYRVPWNMCSASSTISRTIPNEYSFEAVIKVLAIIEGNITLP